MAYRQRTGVAAATQSVLTDDPDFLRFIVERVVQEVLDTEMTSMSVGAIPAARSRSGSNAGCGETSHPTPVSTRTRCRSVVTSKILGSMGDPSLIDRLPES